MIINKTDMRTSAKLQEQNVLCSVGGGQLQRSQSLHNAQSPRAHNPLHVQIVAAITYS